MKPSLSLTFAIGSLVLGLVMAVQMLLPHHISVPSEALFYQSEIPSVPEGTLLRAEGDERVYYASQDQKRWIDAAAFAAQGFRGEDVRVISAAELARYPEGEPITVSSQLVLPRERSILPDLAPLAPYDLRLGKVAGRTVLRFTGSFWNKGRRAFELLTLNQQTAPTAGTESVEDVFQHVLGDDGTYRNKFVGTFVWHPAHNHHHYGDLSDYILEPVKLAPGAVVPPGSTTRQKTTFCLRDDVRMPADIESSSPKAVFTSCGKERQGVSAGWIDVYPSTLPDQYVDVNDLPSGIYALSFLVDPLQRFIELNDDNNISTTFVDLNVQRGTLKVVGSFSPFATGRNTFIDGTLIRTSGNGTVYVLQHGRKRWLKSTEIFASYGYAWDSIYPVTEAMADAIPSQVLIRRQGTPEVYALNERGYRQHIPNPAIFASYGFTAADIADVGDLEFAGYPESNIIVHGGDEQVYRVSGMTKTSVGFLSDLRMRGYDLSGLHVVNDTEFTAYQTTP